MFTSRFKLFNLLGFPIYVDLSWFVIVILITWSLAKRLFPNFYSELSNQQYWMMGLAGALGLFVSIIAHELGHAVVARRFDVPIKGITLFIFGGVAEMEREPPSAKAEFFVAIGGPIVSVVLAIGFYLLGVLGDPVFVAPVAGVLWYLGLVNGLVVGFNLIPAFPLDGGRILRGVLWHVKGNLRWATRITSNLGSTFGLFLIVLGILGLITGNFIGGFWQVLLGIFLRGAAQMSYHPCSIANEIKCSEARKSGWLAKSVGNFSMYPGYSARTSSALNRSAAHSRCPPANSHTTQPSLGSAIRWLLPP